MNVRLAGALIAANCLLAAPASAVAETTIDFEQFPAGTVLTDQYAAAGGAGQGIVFGPLPGAPVGEGLHPIIRVPPAGEAQSGSQVADIGFCFGCEFFTPRTTVSFGVPSSQASVHVGLLGEPGTCTVADPTAPDCAFVTLRAFDAAGAELGQSSVLVARGAGIKSPLSVSTPTASIAGIEITGRPSVDDSKTIAIDDLTFGVAAPPTDCPQVDTAKELVDALAAGLKCVFIVGRIDLATELAGVEVPPHLTDFQSALVIPDGVTLMGGRSPANPGGTLAMSVRSDKSIMLNVGLGTRITGLRLEGYDTSDTKDRDDPTKGVLTRTGGAVIDNNEIFGWPAAGVEVANGPGPESASLVAHNYIHNNVQCNLGYGVVVDGEDQAGFARIEHNVFGFNRHDVAASGGPGASYVASRNFILTSGPTCSGRYNQHFDAHGEHGGYGGTAGTFFEIRDNTIRGAQTYAFLGRLTRPAFELRGTPEEKAIFADNAVAHAYGLEQTRVAGKTLKSKGAVRLEGASFLSLLTKKKLVIKGNERCIDTARELEVGDFDGDGRDDVFSAVGTVWVYSPAGQREWFILNDSRVRRPDLGVGDFDGDGKSDVFFSRGDQWLVSFGGVTAPQPLPAGSGIEVRKFRFGDFDGDGRTDVFRANGSRFFYSSGGATEWLPQVGSRFEIGDLRFGDFDGDGRTDVFSLANGQWSVSDGAATRWRRLNARLSSNLGELAFADFDADGMTDIARSHDGRWQISSGGATPWRTLARERSASLSRGMVFGDFDGVLGDDALQHGEPEAKLKRCGISPLRSFDRWKLSSGGVGPLDQWSVADMR